MHQKSRAKLNVINEELIIGEMAKIKHVEAKAAEKCNVYVRVTLTALGVMMSVIYKYNITIIVNKMYHNAQPEWQTS